MLVIETLDHRDPAVARAIAAVTAPAQAQEAAWLGLPPLPRDQVVRTEAAQQATIQARHDVHIGASEGAGLLGVIGIGPDEEPGQLCITTLVVHPQAQRRGIARALAHHALERGQGLVFVVSAAAGNRAALALYQGLGFVPYRHGTLQPQGIAMLRLRRPAAPAPQR